MSLLFIDVLEPIEIAEQDRARLAFPQTSLQCVRSSCCDAEPLQIQEAAGRIPVFS
jgi:hypothetical protein